MKFDLAKYLAAPEKFNIVNGYGSEKKYLAHSTDATWGGLVVLDQANKSIEQYNLDGVSNPDGTKGNLDLLLEERTLVREVKGMAYVNAGGEIIGCCFEDGSPTGLSEITPYPCTLLIELESALPATSVSKTEVSL